MSWMRRIGSGVFTAALLGLLGLLSVRPVAQVEGATKALSAPFSALAKITWPLSRVELRHANAAAVELGSGGWESESLAQQRLSERFLSRLYASALPRAGGLSAGRRLIPAAVVGRERDDRDVLVIEPWSYEGLAVGLPVVHREAYVGRIAAIERGRARPRVTVELITGATTFVGAEVLPPAEVLEYARPVDRIPLVIGGLALDAAELDALEPRAYLAAHNPAPRRGWFADRPLGGAVVVRELEIGDDPYGSLADGFALGRIERGERDDLWRVDPVLDFLDGLFHVVVLAPAPGEVTELPPEPAHPLDEPSWVRGLAYTAGDPSPWRDSLVVDVGAGSGVEEGAACVAGAALVGRLVEVGPLSSTVARLGDPGLVVNAAALLLDHPDAPPRVLGRLVSLGRAPQRRGTGTGTGTGAVRLRWRAVVPLEALGGAERLRVALFTGSGQPGLPAGLYIGEAWVPTGRAPGGNHEFELLPAPDPLESGREVWLRLPRAGVSGAGSGA